MSPDELADAYLHALGSANIDEMLRLFTADGYVISPLYGAMPARSFYEVLFRETADSQLTLLGVTSGKAVDGSSPLVTIWFHFDWTLEDGRHAPFDVVDVLEIEAGLIRRLHIVYDTADVRPSYEKATGRASYRTK